MIVDNAISSFADATADITDPANLELAQATFNERLLYEAIVSFARDWSDSAHRPARILDLCAATGLTAKRVANAIPVESVTLVDNSAQALSQSRKHFSKEFSVHCYCMDAVTFSDEAPYDIVLANSAYHHIKDNRKPAFLENAGRLLSRDGIFILGDHFLPPYDDEIGHARATDDFYRALVSELERHETDPRAVEVIRSAAKHGVHLDGEYKVSWCHFLSNLESAHVSVRQFELVWDHPRSRSNQLVGSVAAVLETLL